MKKILLLLTVLSVLLSSCASILNGKYQKIAIIKQDESDKILIGGEEAKQNKDKYLL